jgi:hypothetical protein
LKSMRRNRAAMIIAMTRKNNSIQDKIIDGPKYKI